MSEAPHHPGHVIGDTMAPLEQSRASMLGGSTAFTSLWISNETTRNPPSVPRRQADSSARHPNRLWIG